MTRKDSTLARILSLALAVVLLLTSMSVLASAEERPLLEIDIFRVSHPSASLDDLPEEGYPVDLEIGKMFNVKLDVRYVPGANGEEVYNTMMASGDIPTLVQQSFANLDKYADAWVPLNDYIIGKYPNLERAFFDNPIIYSQSANDAGEVRILSSLYSQYMGDTLLVRGDIVDMYNIDIANVSTKEEWHDLLTFIKENEPDMIPYGTRKNRAGIVNFLSEGWSGIVEKFFTEGDTVKFGALDDRFYEVLQWGRQLYSEGLIDLQYPTSGTSQWQEALLGKGIFLTHDNASSRIDWADTQWASMGITDRFYEAVAPMQPQEGVKGYTTVHYPSFQDSWGIVVGTDDETIDRILQIFDFCLSEEGYKLSNWGIEGVYYELDERGAPIFYDEYTSMSSNNRGITLCFPRNVYNSLVFTKNERVSAAIKMYEDGELIKQNYIQALRFTDSQKEIIKTYYTDILTYMDEQLDSFIMGTKELNKENWESFQSTLVNMGIDKVVAVYQEAFQVMYNLMNP